MSLAPAEAPIQQLDQDARNLEILRQSELGIVLTDVYLEAMKLDPRLSEVVVVPLDDDSSTIAGAKGAWNSKSGKPEVHLRLNDLDDALGRVDSAMENIPGAKDLFAAKLGIPPETMTPQMLYVFAVAHEFGHIPEYMDFEDDPEALNRRMKEEKMALPIGNATVSAMMTEGTPAHNYVVENWEAISAQLGVGSVEDLFEKQHNAYRSMTSERLADDFAVDVFTMNPTIVDRMMAPDLAEYRNFPTR